VQVLAINDHAELALRESLMEEGLFPWRLSDEEER
jgi:hypothetical protein